MQPITPEMKDRVLLFLRDECPLEQFVGDDNTEIQKKTGYNFQTISAILEQFQRMGFLSDLSIGAYKTHFVLHAETHDFAHKGGFAIQEEIFKANIEKLQYEIEALIKELGPNHLDSFNKISGIASALLAGIGLLPK